MAGTAASGGLGTYQVVAFFVWTNVCGAELVTEDDFGDGAAETLVRLSWRLDLTCHAALALLCCTRFVARNISILVIP